MLHNTYSVTSFGLMSIFHHFFFKPPPDLPRTAWGPGLVFGCISSARVRLRKAEITIQLQHSGLSKSHSLCGADPGGRTPGAGVLGNAASGAGVHGTGTEAEDVLRTV